MVLVWNEIREILGQFKVKTFFLEVTTKLGQNCKIWQCFQVMTFFLRNATILGRKA